MTPDELEPLDASLSALLQQERSAPPAPGEVKARLQARLRQELFSPGGGGGGNGGGNGGGAPPRGGWASASVAKLAIGIGVASFAVGGVAGRMSAPVPEVAPVAAPLPPAPARSPVVDATPVVAPVAPAVPAAPAPVAAPVRKVPRGGEVDEEHSLIEQARSALARGQGEAALATLDQHQQLFPEGRLSEERLALQVMALRQVGRTDDARALTELFRAQYPDSLLRSAVEE